MSILIGCEFSGVVRDAFTFLGYKAKSLDLRPTETPGEHHQGDIVEYLLNLADKELELPIVHPDCTKLAVSGNATYGFGKPKYSERLEACRWTASLWELSKRKAKRVCFENPVGCLPTLTGLPDPQYIHPWMFGHPERKKTGLFLHNLPRLVEANNVKKWMETLPVQLQNRILLMAPSENRQKDRSRTYPGIASAMATQWSKVLC